MARDISSFRPSIGHGMRFQWEPVQRAHVLLYPEGMIKLNGSAGEIMKRCDGRHTVADITSELEQAFSTQGLASEVEAFVSLAVERKWLQLLP